MGVVHSVKIFQTQLYNSTSFRCNVYPNSIGFPTERENETNNYVAAIVSNEDRLWEKCPEECRREGRVSEWEYC